MSARSRAVVRDAAPAQASDSEGGRTANAWFRIYKGLRDRIVTMDLRPGDPLIEKDIAAAHNVSRTPVREAILKLADEELVEIFPKSGTIVARIPLRALPEAMLIRKAIESMTARLAAEHATGSQILSLVVIVEQQREAAAASDRAAFHQGDEAFHARIAEIGGHPSLWRHVTRIKTQIDRYRQLTLPMPGRMPIVIADHDLILQAIRAREPAQAAAAMERHLDAVLPALIDAVDANSSYFSGAFDPSAKS